MVKLPAPINIEQVGDVSVIRLEVRDYKDATVNQMFRDSLLNHINAEETENLVINLHNVRAMTSETINSLLRAREQLLNRDGELRLCEVEPDVLDVLKMLQLAHKVFPIHGSEANAVKAIN